MATPADVPAATIEQLFAAQRAHQADVKRTTASERIAKLRKLREAIVAREPAIRDAIYKDFRKSATETDITEIFPTLVELKDAIGSLREWMRPKRVATPMALVGTRSYLHYEPKGVVLIIGPWNYPFQLVLAPLVAAVAAGNCVVVKPSELTAHTAQLIAELVAAVFSPDEVTVVQGGPAETQRLLALPFDHVFFTGSTRVGKIVAEAAAKHLASTTLELGGKSPAVVDDTADLHATANRLAWGKFVNAGQTCIAPDYVLVSARRERELVGALGHAIDAMYGADRKASPDFARVINARNYDRLTRLLDDSVARGAKVAIGGERDPAERYLAPTVLTDVAPDAPIMSEEIFGPILPILTYPSLAEAAAFIAARDKPLALYMFGTDQRAIDSMIASTTAGGTTINNTVIHFANPNLPFGGVGASGLGSYHGVYGFKTFSHERGVLEQGRIDALRMVYPPYGEKVSRMMKWMFKLFT
ncbi:MAG TPA: aldehyde dehydrogenase family protein [Kofleriaceae bacterium]|nr:aldehyde dehydrogenase family protein [Kofleriaceae bacterium]